MLPSPRVAPALPHAPLAWPSRPLRRAAPAPPGPPTVPEPPFALSASPRGASRPVPAKVLPDAPPYLFRLIPGLPAVMVSTECVCLRFQQCYLNFSCSSLISVFYGICYGAQSQDFIRELFRPAAKKQPVNKNKLFLISSSYNFNSIYFYIILY